LPSRSRESSADVLGQEGALTEPGVALDDEVPTRVGSEKPCDRVEDVLSPDEVARRIDHERAPLVVARVQSEGGAEHRTEVDERRGRIRRQLEVIDDLPDVPADRDTGRFGYVADRDGVAEHVERGAHRRVTRL
jgi:hypothetical protein